MSIPSPDRRSNLVLRGLIDDTLERVRVLSRDSVRLTERARELAEADLEDVMAHVRRIVSPGSEQAPVVRA